MTRAAERFTVEERADRWRRRYIGPWRTALHEVGPVDVSYRVRYAPMIELVRLWVAMHDAQRVLFRAVLPLVKWLAKRLPAAK